MKRPTARTAAAVLALALLPACRASSYPQMRCGGQERQNLLHLVAQAIPSATIIPCIEPLRPGWSYGGSEVRPGLVHFWLDSDRVGADALDVTVTSSCNVSGDVASQTLSGLYGTPAEQAAARDERLAMFQEPAAEHPNVTVRSYVAAGACATVRYSFTHQTAPTEFDEAQGLLGYDLRSDYVEGIRRETGLTLCGAGAPPCPG